MCYYIDYILSTTLFLLYHFYYIISTFTIMQCAITSIIFIYYVISVTSTMCYYIHYILSTTLYLLYHQCAITSIIFYLLRHICYIISYISTTPLFHIISYNIIIMHVYAEIFLFYESYVIEKGFYYIIVVYLIPCILVLVNLLSNS